jgi:hypothetical protein
MPIIDPFNIWFHLISSLTGRSAAAHTPSAEVAMLYDDSLHAKIIRTINEKYPNAIRHMPAGLSSSFILAGLYMDDTNGKRGL